MQEQRTKKPRKKREPKVQRDCAICGKQFSISVYHANKGHGTFCSKSCRGVSDSGNLADRFWAHVQKSDNACWLWTGTKNAYDYGVFGYRGKLLFAHRVSWELHNNKKIPDGMCILHVCDRPICCCPSHLLLGTKLDNSRDMSRKGRSARGERSGVAKLTEALVIEMRKRYAAGGVLIRELAEEVGMSRPAMGAAIRGENWKHIPL